MVDPNKTNVVEEQSEVVVAPTDLYDIQKFPTSELQRGDPVHSYQQRVQNPSDEAQLIKLSTDAGFVKTVTFGKFFMTRDSEEFSVGGHVGCREYTLFRDNENFIPKGWIHRGTNIGPVLEMTANDHQGKPGIEIKNKSLSGDGSQSWIGISNRLNKFVRD